jgi:RND family efflux transporter MFP subunit
MQLQRKHVFITAAIALLFLVGLSRLFFWKADASQRDELKLPTVAVAVVERKPIVNTVTLSGEFRPYQKVDVHAKVAGYIRQIYVDVGDKVKNGQVLAILEVPELNAQVKGAEADMRRSQDAIHRAEGDLERAKSTYTADHAAYTRLKQASEARSGLIAEQELDDSLAKDKGAEAQVSSARAALAEANSQLAVAEADRNRLAALEAYSHITAPFPGVVTKRYADVGSLIQAGTASNTQAMPVVRLAEWTRLRLVIPVPESAVGQLRLGSSVAVRVPSLNRTFEGRVARFADSLSPETRTMHTEIDVENRDGTLFDGMYAETTLVLSEKENVLTVPLQAVDRNGSKASVLIVDADNRVQVREVKLGMEGMDRVEILGGLAEKDRVIIGNRGEFREGDRVQPKIVDPTASIQEAGL